MRMNKKTIKALKASIAHWEVNVMADTPEDAHLGANYCALCGLFNKETADPPCQGCPVRRKTRKSHCFGSPYGAADCAQDNWADALADKKADPAYVKKAEYVFRAACQDEVMFLRNLLPKEETAP